MNSRIIIIIIIITMIIMIMAASTARAEVPAYETFELQARSNIVDGFNLPPGSSFNSGTPAINASATVAFRLIVVGSSGNAGLWVGGGGAGAVVYEAPADRLLEDPSLNAGGRAAFEQFDIFTDGVFVYDPDAGTSLAIPPGGMYGINTFTTAQINDAGVIGCRAQGIGGNRYLTDAGGVQTSYVDEASSPYGFLFTASFNNAGQLAGKVRVGGTAGNLPDEIRVFEADGSSARRAVDDDGDTGSPYTGFDNSIDLADDGSVTFIANLLAGGRGVFLTDGVVTTTIATTTGDPDLSAIDFFPPRMNGAGLVVFRGKDGAGRSAIFVGDGTTLLRVIGEDDEIPCDLGAARIRQHDGSVPFGGAVTINARGDLAFGAALTPADDDQVEWGSGIYVAYASGAIVPGDVDGDGIVGFDDLLIVLSTWGAAGGPADLDGDGTVGFGDLLIVISNWT